MSGEKLLTVRDVSGLLGISEKQVIELAEDGSIPAYKIGGIYLRFKKEQILEFKKSNNTHTKETQKDKDYELADRFADFFYFNDFYIASGITIILLLIVIFHG